MTTDAIFLLVVVLALCCVFGLGAVLGWLVATKSELDHLKNGPVLPVIKRREP